MGPTLLLSLAILCVDDEPTLYENTELGIQLEAPAGWTLVEADQPAGGALLQLDFVPEDVASARLTVRAARATVDSAEQWRDDAVLPSAHGRPEITGVEAIEIEVGGELAPGAVALVDSQGMRLRFEGAYVLANGFLFSFDASAPDGSFEELQPGFDAIRASFVAIELEGEAAEELALDEIASRCGSEVRWAATWAEAAERARTENKPILVKALFYSSFAISDPDLSGAFMEPAIVALVNERYVPFQLRPGMDTPIAKPENYGLSGSSLGRAFLVATPDGEVVHDGLGSVWAILLDGLRVVPELAGAPASSFDDPLQQATHHIARGELELAGEILASGESAAALRLKASLAALSYDGDGALEQLAAAREAAGPDALAGDIELDETIVFLRMGQLRAAEARLRGFLDSHPDHPRATEARYWLGALLLRLLERDEGAQLLRANALAHPDDRFGWKSAAAVTSTSFTGGQGERIEWPDEYFRADERRRERAPLDPSEAGRAERDALRFLLARQREGGSWPSPIEGGQFLPTDPNEFSLAITSICAEGLLPHRANEAALAAVERAIPALLRILQGLRGLPKRPVFMEYTCWSRMALLSFLAECTAAGLRDVSELEGVVASVLDELRAIRKPDGGWSYYITADLESTGGPGLPSMSFTTAGIVLSLLRAQEVGYDVPHDLIESGLDLVELNRYDDGSFEYMGGAGANRVSGQAGAAGRGPVCARALLRGGRGDLEGVATALEIFVQHRDSLRREQWKSLMHCGSEAQGSHYLFFDYAHAAKAIGELPEAQRGKYRVAVLEEILAARSDDGAYLDNPLIGWSCGTGFAVQAFAMLATDPD